jgi:hypothetical protein
MVQFVPAEIERLLHWIEQRELAREGRATDPEIRDYKHCNVERERDFTTRVYARFLREPFADHPDAWFLSAIRVVINRPEVIEVLAAHPAILLPFEELKFSALLHDLQDAGMPVFANAYRTVIPPRGADLDRIEYAAVFLGDLYHRRDEFRLHAGDTVGALPHSFDALSRAWLVPRRSDLRRCEISRTAALGT